jgi:GxxExxY protein
MKHDDLTYTIIGFAYKVHNVLGAGFLESVYENAQNRAGKSGVAVMQQEKLQVWYENQIVGDYVPDLCARLSFQCPPTHLVDT